MTIDRRNHEGWRKPLPAGRVWAALLAGATMAGGANAAVSPYPDLSITSQIVNSYSYQIGSGPMQTVEAAGGDVHIRERSNEGGHVSELGLDLTAKLAGDSFSYLHNGYCVGTCSVQMNTNLTFTMTNNGDTPLSIRWDSLITPGHLAQIGLSGNAQFSFFILQVQGSDTTQHQLYSALGLTGGWYDSISVSGDPFNALFHDEHSETVAHLNAHTVSDWSATNLNLDLLTIDPHSTTSLFYVSQASAGQMAVCTDLTECDGVQVAFGDPRTSGTADNRQAFFPAFDSNADASQPYIGRSYDVYTAPSVFVTPDTPLPATPDALPNVTYGAKFVSQVPEPANWALLLSGFGIVGAALRRRSTGARAGA